MTYLKYRNQLYLISFVVAMIGIVITTYSLVVESFGWFIIGMTTLLPIGGNIIVRLFEAVEVFKSMVTDYDERPIDEVIRYFKGRHIKPNDNRSLYQHVYAVTTLSVDKRNVSSVTSSGQKIVAWVLSRQMRIKLAQHGCHVTHMTPAHRIDVRRLLE